MHGLPWGRARYTRTPSGYNLRSRASTLRKPFPVSLLTRAPAARRKGGDPKYGREKYLARPPMKSIHDNRAVLPITARARELLNHNWDNDVPAYARLSMDLVKPTESASLFWIITSVGEKGLGATYNLHPTLRWLSPLESLSAAVGGPRVCVVHEVTSRMDCDLCATHLHICGVHRTGQRSGWAKGRGMAVAVGRTAPSWTGNGILLGATRPHTLCMETCTTPGRKTNVASLIPACSRPHFPGSTVSGVHYSRVFLRLFFKHFHGNIFKQANLLMY